MEINTDKSQNPCCVCDEAKLASVPDYFDMPNKPNGNIFELKKKTMVTVTSHNNIDPVT